MQRLEIPILLFTALNAFTPVCSFAILHDINNDIIDKAYDGELGKFVPADRRFSSRVTPNSQSTILMDGHRKKMEANLKQHLTKLSELSGLEARILAKFLKRHLAKQSAEAERDRKRQRSTMRKIIVTSNLAPLEVPK